MRDDRFSQPSTLLAFNTHQLLSGVPMSVFGAYSRYYNLLYKDKDYAGETEYVHGLIQKHCQGAQSILDLGCGTGRHDLLMARKGYDVTGIDLSEEMLAVARSQPLIPHPSSGDALVAPTHPSFHHGDIRSVRLDLTFDAVVSLFHVMSYQTTNDDLRAAFATARDHLKPGGIFVFDCWYGPAVLTDRPVVRVKRLEDDVIAVTRIAEPVMHANQNMVDVNYQVFITDKASGDVDVLKETHQMRYLFLPEIEMYLSEVGMDIVAAEEWMAGKPPGFGSWGVCFVAKRK
jgi:SAM-dependent methyltransferase